MAAFLVAHGAWSAGWAWKKMHPLMRSRGHRLVTPTYTGLGERAHLAHPGIDLDAHIDDMLAVLHYEGLTDVVLVGHSYGGMVITGAADALLARGAVAVEHLVYVDAMVPLPGEGWGQAHPPEIVQARLAAAAAHDNALPPPDPRDFGLEGADREWLLRRQVPHPFGMYRVPLHFDGARWAALPRLFFDCNRPAYPTIDAMRTRVREQPGWRVVEIATGHCPMVSTPEALLRHLLALGAAA